MCPGFTHEGHPSRLHHRQPRLRRPSGKWSKSAGGSRPCRQKRTPISSRTVIHDWKTIATPSSARRGEADEPIAHHRAGAARWQCPRLRQRGHGDDDVDRRRERTAREFESLLARAGLTATRVIPTTTSAIVEAQPT